MAKTFYLLGEINTESLGIIQQIREHKESLEQEGADNFGPESEEIRVVISSEGGDENVGYAIFDTLNAYKGKVITEGYGQVCSIASLIFQAGDQRLLSPNCIFMIHNGSVQVENHIDSRMLDEIQSHFALNNERYYACIAKRCGIAVDKVRNWCNDDTYFSAQEAIKAKLADKLTKVL